MKRRRSEAQLQALADGRDRLRLARQVHLHQTASPSAKAVLPTQFLAGDDTDDSRLQSRLRVHLASLVYISNEGSDVLNMCRTLLSEADLVTACAGDLIEC